MELHTKISELRKKGGLTQQAMADSLNVSRQTISKWETGAVLPDVDNLSRIANLFQVSVDHLLDVESDKIDKHGQEEIKSSENKLADVPVKDKTNKNKKDKFLILLVCLSFLTVLTIDSPMVASLTIVFLIGAILLGTLIVSAIAQVFKTRKK